MFRQQVCAGEAFSARVASRFVEAWWKIDERTARVLPAVNPQIAFAIVFNRAAMHVDVPHMARHMELKYVQELISEQQLLVAYCREGDVAGLLSGQLAETEGQLAEKEGQIAEQKGQIAEQKGQIAEQKGHIAEQKRQLAEKDAIIADLRRQLESR